MHFSVHLITSFEQPVNPQRGVFYIETGVPVNDFVRNKAHVHRDVKD